MAGIERMLKYAEAKPEGPVMTATRASVVWPQYGIVTFEGVSLHYGEDHVRVLKNMWCCFRAEEKVRSLSTSSSLQDLSNTFLSEA